MRSERLFFFKVFSIIALIVSSSYGAAYFWDISTSGGYQAGDGTWGSNNYWTLNGTSLVAWPGSGNSATFAGTDGAVGDYWIGVNGTQNVDSIAFLSNGYWLNGGTAVNFGSKKGVYVASGKSAIIATPITATAGIIKTGGGSLFFGTTFAYSGGTTISAGVLCIGYGSDVGSVSGNIVNNDTLMFNRSDSYTCSGNISGSGKLIKYGSGTLILTGTNTHSGITANADGAGLQIGNNGTTGSVSGNIENSQPLTFYRSNSYTYGGVISGPGAVNKSGSGTLIFTGNNTYGGTTTINSGTLQIGNNGTTGVIAGNIANSTALVFYRSNDYTYGYVISGSGTVTKNGAGALTLTGGNTYSGQTIVSAGTLVFSGSGSVYNNGTSAGSIEINNGTTVRLDRTDFMGNHVATPVATVTIDAGGTMASNGTFNTLNNLTLSGGTLLSNGGLDGNYGPFALKGTVTVNGTVTSNFSIGSGSFHHALRRDGNNVSG
ncbi:MAG: autotransporter-associated beta strand repeat-containing protein [Chitinispirillaceae bacterium]|nr:autotransporter-associated beta strand repeat-containing protein [Chitinispirillaceae bacterium]